ncbi:LytR/AlgR family response regulator transcription factor [Bacteroides salyersiae]|uniref:LytR/AlgR family response regulator transcription factor n=1 Tax=Bacteroides salyersiae TaxID=291644 RepID=UPI001C8CEFC8|nr:LytTR family DNA-binding domain-containing protein [Bacteroides salyersiae]
MIKYLLVEDERFAYEEIKRMIQTLRTDYQMVGWAESVEQAVRFLKQGNIDLMIVDIRLSDGVSFEIFEQYPVDVPVIFTTAYDEYALKAFKVNSIDYLLKPIEEKELDTALCKFERKNYLNYTMPEYKKLEELYLSNNKKNRFLIQIGDSFQYVKTDDIAFFYSEEKYIYLHLFSNRRYIINYSLEQLECMLEGNMFFRVSRNCVANIKSIQRSSKYFGSRLKLYFLPECPHEVLVSRNRVNDFLNWIDDIKP